MVQSLWAIVCPFLINLSVNLGFPGGWWWMVKMGLYPWALPKDGKGWVSCLQCRRPGFNSWVRKIPWRREWLPTPIFLPGEFHAQRSLAGYSPWGCKELDRTERLSVSVNLPYETTIWCLNIYLEEMKIHSYTKTWT